MEIEEALYSYLSTYSGLTALVSTRIYPASEVSESASNTAFVTYELVEDDEIHVSGGNSAPSHPIFNVTCWGTDYSNSIAIAKQVKTALRDYSGLMGGASGVTIQSIFFDNARDVMNVVSDGIIRKGRALEFKIWYE